MTPPILIAELELPPRLSNRLAKMDMLHIETLQLMSWREVLLQPGFSSTDVAHIERALDKVGLCLRHATGEAAISPYKVYNGDVPLSLVVHLCDTPDDALTAVLLGPVDAVAELDMHEGILAQLEALEPSNARQFAASTACVLRNMANNIEARFVTPKSEV